MLIYNELKNKPREFLAATGLKLDEFEQLLPAFQTAYEKKYPPHLTQEGKTRQRQSGGRRRHRGIAEERRQALLHPGLSEDQPPANDARLAIWVESTPSQRLDSSAPASLATGLAHPRGGPRARCASCGDQ